MNKTLSWSMIGARLDAILIGLTAPFLLFPNAFHQALPIVAWVMLLLFETGRLYQWQQTQNYRLIFLPVHIILFVLLPLTLWVTPLPTISWPAATTLTWSIGLFFSVQQWVGLEKSQEEQASAIASIPTYGYLAIGFITILVGTLGMDVPEKFVPRQVLSRWQSFFSIGRYFHPNEVGGIVTLLLPLTLFLWLKNWPGSWGNQKKVFLLLTAVNGILAAVLLFSQSRSSLLAVGLAVALAMLLLGIRERWLLAGIFLLFGFWSFSSSGRLIWEKIMLSGAITPHSVFAARLSIWQQAVRGGIDFSVSGMGLAVFGHVVPTLYPMVPVESAVIVDDAHNLFIQTIADFGFPGLCILLWLIVGMFVSIRHWWKAISGKKADRYLVLGLTASLTAYLIFSLTDTLALGSPAGIFFWILCGLIIAATPQPTLDLFRSPIKHRRFFLLWAGLLLALGYILLVAWPLNRTAVESADLFLNSSLTASTRTFKQPLVCQENWYIGLQNHYLEGWSARDKAWITLLNCTEQYISFMETLAPDDQHLAEVAVQAQPDSPNALFWLAKIVANEDVPLAIDLYRQGLKLAPKDARSWVDLGNLLLKMDSEAALAAFAQSCMNGDPGANGCWRAGQTAENLGNFSMAIEFYQASFSPTARARAQTLQSMMGNE